MIGAFIKPSYMYTTPTQQHTLENGLERLFGDYLSVCRYSKRLSPKTIRSYSEVFSTFSKIMPEIRELQDLCPQMMTEFFKRISTRERTVGKGVIVVGVMPSTVKTYHNKLMAFFKWLEYNGHLEGHSLTKRITGPPEPVYDDHKALTDGEVSKIIASITLFSMEDDFVHGRDLAIASLLLYTGVRKGELLALRIGDVDFASRKLLVRGRTSKSKRDRYIPMHFSLVSHLRSYLREREKRSSTCASLITSSRRDAPLTEHGLKFWVNKYKRLSGVDFHIHRFRHTLSLIHI